MPFRVFVARSFSACNIVQSIAKNSKGMFRILVVVVLFIYHSLVCCYQFVPFVLFLYCGGVYGDGEGHFISLTTCWNFNNASFTYPGIENVTVLFL